MEPTDFCNARCFYCIQSLRDAPHASRAGFLTMEMHQKILDGLEDFIKDPLCAPANDNAVYLRYGGIGEPTLNPRFFDMYQQALKISKLRNLAILTNGTGWNKNFTDAFILCAKERKNVAIELVFSLDTLSNDVRFKIKRLGGIDVIIGNLLYLLDLIAESGLTNIHPVFQMIVLKENVHEAEAFVEFWKTETEKRGISFRLVQDGTYGKHFPETIAFLWLRCLDGRAQPEAQDLHKTALARLGCSNVQASAGLVENTAPLSSCAHKPVCGVMWYGINVMANGDVTPCCLDINLELLIGNIMNSTLKAMYLSEKMVKLRQDHIGHALSGYEVCRNCDFMNFAPPVDEDDIEAYCSRKKILRED